MRGKLYQREIIKAVKFAKASSDWHIGARDVDCKLTWISQQIVRCLPWELLINTLAAPDSSSGYESMFSAKH